MPRRRCAIVPHVDRHLVRHAMDASTTPVFGWTVASSCKFLQVAYAIQIAALAATPPSRVVHVKSNQSEGVAYPDNLPPLASGTAHVLTVTATFADGSNAIGSSPFVTALSQSAMEAVRPMWHTNDSAKYVLFRAVVPAAPAAAAAYLAVSAKPSPAWNKPHGVNTSHLLCSYKLWVNGVPLGVGPGRIVGNRIAVDTFNVTRLLSPRQPNVIAISAYYQTKRDSFDSTAPDDHGGVVAILHSGGATIADRTDPLPPLHWSAFDATAATNPSLGAERHGDGTRAYNSPHENFLGALYPFSWRTSPNLTASDHVDGWSAAVPRALFAEGLAPKRAYPVSLRPIPASSFALLPPNTPSTYRYVIDFGHNFQGHVNISFASGAPGQRVVVRLGEQLLTNGSVKWVSESKNVWNEVWTLRGDGARETYVPHEYAEFRWAEIIGAPELPTPERVNGWQVHYPFDGELNENGLVTIETSDAYASSDAAAMMGAADGLTRIETSDAALSAVWELVRHTIKAAALDLNTDSNTRQRDLCTLDAWLTTRYQSGVAPATAVHLRRRVTQSMWEPNGYVNYWTEFLVAHVGALHDYVFDYGDTTLAKYLWNLSWQFPLPTATSAASGDPATAAAPAPERGRPKDPPPQNKEHFSLTAFWNASTQLVHETPRPLVDWPRSSGIDTDAEKSSHCAELCVQMNAYAVQAHEWIAGLAQTLGKTSDATTYAARAAAIRAAAQAAFSTTKCDVSPSTLHSQQRNSHAALADADQMECYRDNLASISPAYTSATAASTAAFATLPGSAAGVLALVPFLAARNARRGASHGLEVSGWMAGFMCEGVYRAAGEVSEGPLPLASVSRAVEFVYSVLVNRGANSWLSMIAQNATMTMESWTLPPLEDEGGGTFSHPWTAAPAYLIPRFLMGVRPLDTAWRRVAIRPLPPKSLKSASVHMPTMRGEIALSFAMSRRHTVFAANVTLPGNTVAQLCLPRYLFEDGTGPSPAASTHPAPSRCTISIGGEEQPLLEGGLTGGMACLAGDLGPGSHTALLRCP